MAKSLMIQGTGSGVGKSLIVAALCRIFRDRGLRVAPFKAQNMALNSYITRDGGEIGRAQALQAEAARVEPTVDMNPILLKTSGETGSQIIIHGKVYAQMKAQKYYAFKREAWEFVKASFARLTREYDLLILEGAGSPAEINLRDVEIVNMNVARHARAPVILVGDIDKGGVFASLYGTVKLVGRDSRFIKGFIINKFRGDPAILRPGLDMIAEKTGRPVIGVLPYLFDIGLPEEDGLALYQTSGVKKGDPGIEKIRVVVVRLRSLSNFTDFDPFLYEPDVELLYSENASEIGNADLVILPGSKNTVRDLLFLKERHLDESIRHAQAKGVQVIGVCGGYQMLGRKIFDPHTVESRHRDMDGIGLLNIETTFESEKTTCQVEAEWADGCEALRGYEIHMGVSSGEIGLFRVRRLSGGNGESREAGKGPSHNGGFRLLDGSRNGNCWGTYIHGIFDNDRFRRTVINEVRRRKGMPPLKGGIRYAEVKEKALNRLADVVSANIDLDYVRRIAGL